MTTKKRVRVGVNLRFFRADSETETESDELDLEKFLSAARGYAKTIELVKHIERDERFKEFVSIAQGVLGELVADDQRTVAHVLTWYRELKSPKMWVIGGR